MIAKLATIKRKEWNTVFEIKCKNIINKQNCKGCRHRKQGIFNKDKKIKPELEKGFKNRLNRIAEKYGS